MSKKKRDRSRDLSRGKFPLDKRHGVLYFIKQQQKIQIR